MATYKGIQGCTVQTLATDPSPTASAEGQLWYNSTSFAYKMGTAGAGAWASAPAVNTARRSMGSAGTVTATLIAGGISPGGGGSTATETYNGSAWTTSPATLNTGRQYLKGDGSSTAAIVFGGVGPPVPAYANTETFNGSTWTEQTNDLNTARQKMGNSTLGSTTASLCFGGSGADPSPTKDDETEKWNGTSWTEVADLNTARQGIGGAGTSTAALSIGGNPPESNQVESWNGTSWTELTPNLNTARSEFGSAGSQTSAIIWGGNPSSPGLLVEQWNGTSWTEVADTATKRAGGGSAGATGSSAYAISGYDGSSNLTTTETWTDPVYAIKTVTVS